MRDSYLPLLGPVALDCWSSIVEQNLFSPLSSKLLQSKAFQSKLLQSKAATNCALNENIWTTNWFRGKEHSEERRPLWQQKRPHLPYGHRQISLDSIWLNSGRLSIWRTLFKFEFNLNSPQTDQIYCKLNSRNTSGQVLGTAMLTGIYNPTTCWLFVFKI